VLGEGRGRDLGRGTEDGSKRTEDGFAAPSAEGQDQTIRGLTHGKRRTTVICLQKVPPRSPQAFRKVPGHASKRQSVGRSGEMPERAMNEGRLLGPPLQEL